MAGVCRAERDLLQEDGLRELDARLEAGAKVEVDAHIGVVAVLVVSDSFDRQDVERHHHAIDGQQHRLVALVHLRRIRLPQQQNYPIRSIVMSVCT